MMMASALQPLALSAAQPASAAFGSRSAMMTFAPASASASALASPIPWPAPVTTATRPPSLNFSRYIFSLFPVTGRSSAKLRRYVPFFGAADRRIRSLPNDLSLLAKTVQAGRIRRKPDAVAGFQAEFSDAARRKHSEFPGIDIEEGVAAQMLGDRYGAGPAFSLFADFQMFGPDAQGGDAGLAGGLSRHEIHLGRTDEAGDEKIGGAFVKVQRRAVLFDAASVEHDDLVGHGHGLDLVVGHIDGRGPELLLQLGDFQAHLDAKRGVEI